MAADPAPGATLVNDGPDDTLHWHDIRSGTLRGLTFEDKRGVKYTAGALVECMTARNVGGSNHPVFTPTAMAEGNCTRSATAPSRTTARGR